MPAHVRCPGHPLPTPACTRLHAPLQCASRRAHRHTHVCPWVWPQMCKKAGAPTHLRAHGRGHVYGSVQQNERVHAIRACLHVLGQQWGGGRASIEAAVGRQWGSSRACVGAAVGRRAARWEQQEEQQLPAEETPPVGSRQAVAQRAWQVCPSPAGARCLLHTCRWRVAALLLSHAAHDALHCGRARRAGKRPSCCRAAARPQCHALIRRLATAQPGAQRHSRYHAGAPCPMPPRSRQLTRLCRRATCDSAPVPRSCGGHPPAAAASPLPLTWGIVPHCCCRPCRARAT